MATSESTPVPTRENAERIARAAAKLFAAEGYDATSVRTIVEAACVTKPTLYYYYASKEALAQQLLTGAIDRLIARDREILSGGACAIDKLAAIIEERFLLCREDPDLARFAYATFFGPRSAHFGASLDELGQSLVTLMIEAVTGLANERIIPRERIEECSAAVRGLITVYTLDYLYGGVALGEDLSRRLVDNLLQGFSQRAAALDAEPRRS